MKTVQNKFGSLSISRKYSTNTKIRETGPFMRQEFILSSIGILVYTVGFFTFLALQIVGKHLRYLDPNLE